MDFRVTNIILNHLFQLCVQIMKFTNFDLQATIFPIMNDAWKLSFNYLNKLVCNKFFLHSKSNWYHACESCYAVPLGFFLFATMIGFIFSSLTLVSRKIAKNLGNFKNSEKFIRYVYVFLSLRYNFD